MLAAKDTEIAGLRSHITDALALVPSSMYGDQTLGMMFATFSHYVDGWLTNNKSQTEYVIIFRVAIWSSHLKTSQLTYF